jgi:hypothetical protein
MSKPGPLVNIELSRRMAAVKVSNFYGSIIKDAEKEIERLHTEKALLENIKELQAAQIAQLLEALEKLSLYVAHNGDDWVQREARAAIAAVKEMK